MEQFRIVLKTAGGQLTSQIMAVASGEAAAEAWLEQYQFGDCMVDTGWKQDMTARVWRRKLVQTPGYNEIPFAVMFTIGFDHSG